MIDRFRLAGVASTVVVALAVAGWSFFVPPGNSAPKDAKSASKQPAIQKSDAEWKKQLTPQEYEIVRKKGTEAPFTGAYWNNHKQGVYKCTGCGKELFKSDTKYDSGCGWPSFYKAAEGAEITETPDMTLGMVRTEVTCTNCGAHLGHVFDDSPKPTGMRYCINSASLKFAEGKTADVSKISGKGMGAKGPLPPFKPGVEMHPVPKVEVLKQQAKDFAAGKGNKVSGYDKVTPPAHHVPGKETNVH